MQRHLTLSFLLFASFAHAQPTQLSKNVFVKTNLLNLIAKSPAITVEKLFTKTFSAELSFVQGRFDHFLFTDHYRYNGFLLRAKKYLSVPEYNQATPFAGIYIGNLKRDIQTPSFVDNTGWISYPSRDFSAHSIRGGATAGLTFVSRKRIVVESLVSLGLGRYVAYYKADKNSKGYLDTQLWLSVGYCF